MQGIRWGLALLLFTTVAACSDDVGAVGGSGGSGAAGASGSGGSAAGRGGAGGAAQGGRGGGGGNTGDAGSSGAGGMLVDGGGDAASDDGPAAPVDSPASDSAADLLADATVEARPTSPEEWCRATGGKVVESSCCQATNDFPSMCHGVGACGCAPANSHMIKTCACTGQGCFLADLGCGLWP